MSKYVINDTTLTGIGDAIRTKKGTSAQIPVPNLASEILSIPSGGITPTGTINITSNGTTDVTQYASANVQVPTGVFPSGTLSITENGTKDVTNYENVNVAVPGPSGSQTYTQNGTYDVSAIAEAVINVSGGVTGYKVATGSFTLDEDKLICQSRRAQDAPEVPTHNPYTIEHNLGEVPRYFVVWDDDSSMRTTGTVTSAFILNTPATTGDRLQIMSGLYRINGSTNNTGLTQTIYTAGADASTTPYTRDKHNVAADERYAYVGDKDGASTVMHDYILKAGRTYKWLAIADEGWYNPPTLMSMGNPGTEGEEEP